LNVNAGVQTAPEVCAWAWPESMRSKSVFIKADPSRNSSMCLRSRKRPPYTSRSSSSRQRRWLQA
jgi:hypothetical protein